MSDRYELVGSFYPNPDDQFPSGVSVYFPGTALIAAALKTFLPNNYLVHVMLLIAVSTVLLFFAVQKRIITSIEPHANTNNFQSVAIIFSLFIANSWLIYAIEFKPDTIAILLGSAGILIARADKKGDILSLRFVLGGLLTGSALIFKQQYLAFLMGMVFYSFICRNKAFQLFTILANGFALIVLFVIYENKNTWFWTVTVLSDDGFISLRQWAFAHAHLFIVVAQCTLFLVAAYLNDLFGSEKGYRQITRRHLLSSPWPTIMFFTALGGFAGAWKVGGNDGNTAIGLIVFLPLIYLVVQHFDRRMLIVLAWAILLGQIAPAYKAVDAYRHSSSLTEAVKSLSIRSDAKVLTGSDVYVAAHVINTSNPIENYWARSVRSGSDVSTELGKVLEEERFDYLIVESWPRNKQYIANSNRYSIVFENELGIVAIRK